MKKLMATLRKYLKNIISSNIENKDGLKILEEKNKVL